MEFTLEELRAALLELNKGKTLGERMREEQESLRECNDDLSDTILDEPTILEEAQGIVDGERREEYGDVNDAFMCIAGMWSSYLGSRVTKYDVAHMMIMLKLARNRNNYKADSMRDVAGYAYCADKMHACDDENDEFFSND